MTTLEYAFVTRQLWAHMKSTLSELECLYKSRGEQKKITPKRLDCVLCGPYNRLLLARDRGKLVGCAVIDYGESPILTVGIIHGIVVRPSHKKKGVREGLIAKLQSTAAERDVTSVVVL